MKMKKILTTVMLFTCIALSACGTNKNDTKDKSNSEQSSVELTSFDDDISSCKYDSSQLEGRTVTPNHACRYCVIFSKDNGTSLENMMNSSCSYIGKFNHSVEGINKFSDSEKLLLYKSLLSGIFGFSSDNPAPEEKTGVPKHGLYEYSAKDKDSNEYYATIYLLTDSEFAVSVSRIMHTESKKYHDALYNCYKSFRFKEKPSENNLNEDESDTSSDESARITSGSLYNSLKSNYSDFDELLNIKSKDKKKTSYCIILTEKEKSKKENAKKFVKHCSDIYLNHFNKNDSVVFTGKDSDDFATILIFTVGDDARITSTLSVLDDDYEKALNDAYSNNAYFSVIDMDVKNEAAFNKIKEKYN